MCCNFHIFFLISASVTVSSGVMQLTNISTLLWWSCIVTKYECEYYMNREKREPSTDVFPAAGLITAVAFVFPNAKKVKGAFQTGRAVLGDLILGALKTTWFKLWCGDWLQPESWMDVLFLSYDFKGRNPADWLEIYLEHCFIVCCVHKASPSLFVFFVVFFSFLIFC